MVKFMGEPRGKGLEWNRALDAVRPIPEVSRIMSTKKILFPVCDELRTADIVRHSFWLARSLPAELYLVEVVRPTSWIARLLSPLRKRKQRRRLAAVREGAMWHESFYCEIRDVYASNWASGIIEAARQVQPHVILLSPELQERLGAAGLWELKRYLGQGDRCTLILLTRSLAWASESCSRPVLAPLYVDYSELRFKRS